MCFCDDVKERNKTHQTTSVKSKSTYMCACLNLCERKCLCSREKVVCRSSALPAICINFFVLMSIFYRFNDDNFSTNPIFIHYFCQIDWKLAATFDDDRATMIRQSCAMIWLDNICAIMQLGRQDGNLCREDQRPIVNNRPRFSNNNILSWASIEPKENQEKTAQ